MKSIPSLVRTYGIPLAILFSFLKLGLHRRPYIMGTVVILLFLGSSYHIKSNGLYRLDKLASYVDLTRLPSLYDLQPRTRLLLVGGCIFLLVFKLLSHQRGYVGYENGHGDEETSKSGDGDKR